LQAVCDNVLSFSDVSPPATPLGALPRCGSQPHALRGCVTLLYAPAGVPWVRQLMAEVAHRNGLTLDVDIVALGGASSAPRPFALCVCESADCATFFPAPLDSPAAAACLSGALADALRCRPCALAEDAAALAARFVAAPGATQNAVHFLSAYVPWETGAPFSNDTLVNYNLHFNASVAQWPWRGRTLAAETKRAVDEAALALALPPSRRAAASLAAAQRPYPRPPSRIAGVDLAGGEGSVFFYVPPCLLFFHLLTEIVDERERRVRLAMSVMGTRRAAYWAAWAAHAAALSAAGAAVQLAAGAAAGFDIYRRASPPALFLVFFNFSMAMCGFGAFASALVPTPAAAQSVGYAAILLGFVFQCILSTGYGAVIALIAQRSSDLPHWFVNCRRMASLWPPYHFAKSYYDISALSSKRISFSAATVTQGPGYTWSDLRKASAPRVFGMRLDVPPTANALLALAGLALGYGLLGAYFDAVLPGAQGAHVHPLAPLHPAFWGLHAPRRPAQRRRRQAASTQGWDGDVWRERAWDVFDSWAAGGGDGMAAAAAALAASAEPEAARGAGVAEEEAAAAAATAAAEASASASASSARPPALVVHALWKVYGPGPLRRAAHAALHFVRCAHARAAGAPPPPPPGPPPGCNAALRGISLTARSGALLAVLGANGSGKSTLLSILGALARPSAGAASSSASVSVGVCPQQDALWEALSCEEHLRLFARLKGVPSAQLDAEVAARLADVALSARAASPASALSGGMKRRLSCALACVGDPNVLLLDEPSAGLDPHARRRLWAVLARLKRSRCVVMMTHDMAECERVADRVAVMAHGTLRAIGTPLQLKAALGVGYRIALAAPPGADGAAATAAAAAALCGALPGSALEPGAAGGAAVRVPGGDAEALLPAALRALQDAQDAGAVAEWGVSHATLEDVFLELMRRDAEAVGGHARSGGGAHAPDADEAWVEDDAPPPGDGACAVAMPGAAAAADPRTRRPVTALLLKSVAQARCGRGGALAQLAAPAAVCLLLRGLQGALRANVGDAAVPFLLAPPPWPLNGNLLAPAGATSSPPGTLDNACSEFFLFSEDAPPAAAAAGALPPWQRTPGAGLLGRMPRRDCTLLVPLPGQSAVRGGASYGALVPYFEYPISVPYFERRADEGRMTADLYKTLVTLNAAPIADVSRTGAAALPDGAVAFHAVDAANASLHYTFSVNDAVITAYHRGNNFSRVDASLSGIEAAGPDLGGQLLLLQEAALSLMALLHVAFAESVLGAAPRVPPAFAASLPPGVAPLLAHGFAQRMPGMAALDVGAIVELLGAFMYPLALSLPLPLFLHALVAEREAGLRALTAVHGVSSPAYALASAIVFFAQYAASAGVLCAVGAACGLRMFTQTGGAVLVPLLAAWGAALVAMSFALAACVRTRRAATVLGYAVALFATLVCIAVATGVYGDIPALSLPLPMPGWLLLAPPMALSRAMYLLNFACAAKKQCARSWADAPAEVGAAVGALFGMAVLLMAAALCVERIGGRDGGGVVGVRAAVARLRARAATVLRAAAEARAAAARRRSGYGALNEPGGAAGDGEQLLPLNADDDITPVPPAGATSPLRAAPAGSDDHTAPELLIDIPLQEAQTVPSALPSAPPPWSDGISDSDGDALSDSDDDADGGEELAASRHTDEAVAAERAAAADAAPADVPLLCRGLAKRYASAPRTAPPALAGLWLAARSGCFTLLGPNGAGKSTLLSLLTGAASPSGGLAWLAGHPVGDGDADGGGGAPAASALGVCPQGNALWDELSVEDHLRFWARVRGVPSASVAAAVVAAAAAVGLAPQRRSGIAAGALSGGMRRRLCLAAALVGEPPVVLLDEPSAGLDPATRRRVWRALAAARAAPGRCMLLTTHAMDEADVLATRCAFVLLCCGHVRFRRH
jgi:ABC-type multidrug transport system ATPase subunit